MKRIRFGVVVLLVLAMSLSVLADQGAEIERLLNDLYKGKILTLRHFYQGERLRFDTEGNLLKGGKPGPWTLYGKVEIGELNLEKDQLEIRGNRIFLLYDKDKEDFRYLRGEKFRVELELSQAPANISSVQQSLRRVLLVPDENLWDVVPDYWHDFLKAKSAPDKAVDQYESLGGEGAENPTASDQTPYRIGGDVSAPSCISCSAPEYTDPARRVPVEGAMVLWVIVNEEGKAEGLHVSEPLGMGMDDAAIDAVRGWRFKPAMRDGRPVSVFMTVEMHYHLYERR